MRFTKMHGAGNDYVYVDCFDQPLPENPAELARRVADRHFGIGGDGLVLICPSDKADARMRMFNADGSEAEMCGNAIRCVGKYVHDRGIVPKDTLTVETGAGILTLELETTDGKVDRARVDMGQPILEPVEVPTTLPGNPSIDGSPAVDVDLSVGGKQLQVSCVSMGNPHCITFVDEPTDEWVLGIGPSVENDEHFPNRTNAEFVKVISPAEIQMRVWERGSGETLACGTGACAVAVAAALSGRGMRKVTVHLLGGDLEIEWAEDGNVYQTGPAEEVFHGTWQPR